MSLEYSMNVKLLTEHRLEFNININVLQQTACLVVNPITVGNFAFLFNCTPVGRTDFRLYDGSYLKTLSIDEMVGA